MVPQSMTSFRTEFPTVDSSMFKNRAVYFKFVYYTPIANQALNKIILITLDIRFLEIEPVLRFFFEKYQRQNPRMTRFDPGLLAREADSLPLHN